VTIGKIQRQPLRSVWKHEAHDFTRWLQDNIDVVNDVLDRNLSSPEREQSAGSFNVDLLAEDENGNSVVIENQLEKSDHDHLGKLLTYLASFSAKAAIWIVADPRPEHVNAISWLNESSSADFYLIKVEAISIGESEPAPLLTLITGPSEVGRTVGVKKKEIAERHVLRERFWRGLLEKARAKSRLHGSISPSRSSWVGAGAGMSGLAYNYVIGRQEARVELYIDRGPDCDAENKSIFDALVAEKPRIAEVFGGPLDWQSLEGKRACRISYVVTSRGYRDPEDSWPEIQDQMVDAMCRLEAALKPGLGGLSRAS